MAPQREVIQLSGLQEGAMKTKQKYIQENRHWILPNNDS